MKQNIIIRINVYQYLTDDLRQMGTDILNGIFTS